MKMPVKQVLFRDIEQGFTLIEVLVAVLVFSFGLLGIAGMMTISVRNNHNGYLRSQANFLAENMVDRMRANQVALWNDSYGGTAVAGGAACTAVTPCNFDELAGFDMQQWAVSLEETLPEGSGSISCVDNGVLSVSLPQADFPSIWSPVPPYEGICTVTVSWDESNRSSSAETQEVVLVVQP